MIEVIQTLRLSANRQAEFFTFAFSACRLDANSLGWLPKQAYLERHEQGRIHVCYNNEDLVGYCLWFDDGRELRIYSTWVRPDAREILHGKALVDAVEQEGSRRGATRITLWCATDLAANEFWKALQFRRGMWRWGRGRNPRRHRFWSRWIKPQRQPQDAGLAIAREQSNQKAFHPS